MNQRTLETSREARADGIRSDQPQRKGEGDAVNKYAEPVRAGLENQERVSANGMHRLVSEVGKASSKLGVGKSHIHVELHSAGLQTLPHHIGS